MYHLLSLNAVDYYCFTNTFTNTGSSYTIYSLSMQSTTIASQTHSPTQVVPIPSTLSQCSRLLLLHKHIHQHRQFVYHLLSLNAVDYYCFTNTFTNTGSSYTIYSRSTQSTTIASQTHSPTQVVPIPSTLSLNAVDYYCFTNTFTNTGSSYTIYCHSMQFTTIALVPIPSTLTQRSRLLLLHKHIHKHRQFLYHLLSLNAVDYYCFTNTFTNTGSSYTIYSLSQRSRLLLLHKHIHQHRQFLYHLLSLNAVDYYCFTNTFTNTGSSYTIYSLSTQSTTIASQTHSQTQVVPLPSTLSQCSRLLLLHKHIHKHRQFLYHLLSLNAVDYYCFTNTFTNTGSSYTIYSLSTQSTTTASQTHSPTQVVPIPSTLTQRSRLLLLHKHIHQHRQFLYHLLSLNAVDYYCFTNTFTNTGSSSTIYSLSTQSTTIASQTHSQTQVVPIPSTLTQRSRLLLLHKHIHQHRQFLYHLLSLNAVDYYCFTNTFTNTGSSYTIYSLSTQSTTIASQTHSQTQVVPIPSTLSQRSRLLLLHKHIHKHRQLLYHLLSLNAVDYYCFTNTFTNTGSSSTIYSHSTQSTTIASQTHSPTQVVPIPSTLSQCSRLLLLHKHIHKHRQFLYHLLSLNAVDYYCFTNTFTNTGSSYTIYSHSMQSTTIASQTHSPTQVVPIPSTLSQCSRLLLLHKHIHQHRQFLYHLLSLNAVDYYCFTNTFTNTGSSYIIYSLSMQSTTIASQTHSPTQVVLIPSTLTQRSRLLLLHKHIHQHRQFLYHLLSLNAVDYYFFTNTFTNTGSSYTIYSLLTQSTTIASQTHSQTQVVPLPSTLSQRSRLLLLHKHIHQHRQFLYHLLSLNAVDYYCFTNTFTNTGSSSTIYSLSTQSTTIASQTHSPTQVVPIPSTLTQCGRLLLLHKHIHQHRQFLYHLLSLNAVDYYCFTNTFTNTGSSYTIYSLLTQSTTIASQTHSPTQVVPLPSTLSQCGRLLLLHKHIHQHRQFLYHLLSLNAVDYYCFTNTFTNTGSSYTIYSLSTQSTTIASQTHSPTQVVHEPSTLSQRSRLLLLHKHIHKHRQFMNHLLSLNAVDYYCFTNTFTNTGSSYTIYSLSMQSTTIASQTHSQTQVVPVPSTLSQRSRLLLLHKHIHQHRQFLYHLLSLNAVDYYCFTNTFTNTGSSSTIYSHSTQSTTIASQTHSPTQVVPLPSTLTQRSRLLLLHKHIHQHRQLLYHLLSLNAVDYYCFTNTFTNTGSSSTIYSLSTQSTTIASQTHSPTQVVPLPSTLSQRSRLLLLHKHIHQHRQFLYHLLSLNAVDYYCFTNTFTNTGSS